MKLWLAIRGQGKIVETAVVSWSSGCWRKILPKRKPEKKDRLRIWVVKPERRRAFGTYANKMLERFNEENSRCHNEEALYGFFALAGIGTRWADNKDVEWCLVLGDQELEAGDAL